MKRFSRLAHNGWVLFIAGLLIGAVVILGIRVATFKAEEAVHYHANFAVYINGQREQFKALNYYEEETATTCSASAAQESENTPMARVHMHGNISDVVHVEDHLVTWGNFFNVLGWSVGKNYLATRDNVYQPSSASSLTFMLNGKKVDDISNTIIGDQDKLLVNFGDQNTSQIQAEYNLIQNKAKQADTSKDPAGCGGASHGMPSFNDRMHHMF